MRPSIAAKRATSAAVFEAYVEQVIAPSLRRGQTVVMDNLTAHKTEWVRELVEARGCELLYSTSHPTHRISTPSRKPSPRSGTCCAELRLAPVIV